MLRLRGVDPSSQVLVSGCRACIARLPECVLRVLRVALFEVGHASPSNSGTNYEEVHNCHDSSMHGCFLRNSQSVTWLGYETTDDAKPYIHVDG